MSTRTRGLRIVATGQQEANAKRVWGILCNAGTGSVVIRDGGAGGAVLWDGNLVANQWIPFMQPVAGSGGGTPGFGTAGAGIHVTLTGVTDITLQVDY